MIQKRQAKVQREWRQFAKLEQNRYLLAGPCSLHHPAAFSYLFPSLVCTPLNQLVKGQKKLISQSF